MDFNVNALDKTLSNLGDVYTREMFMYDMVINDKISDLDLRDSIANWLLDNHGDMNKANFGGAMAVLSVMSWAGGDKKSMKRCSIIATDCESNLGSLVIHAYLQGLPFDIFRMIIIKAGENHMIGAVSDREVQ